MNREGRERQIDGDEEREWRPLIFAKRFPKFMELPLQPWQPVEFWKSWYDEVYKGLFLFIFDLAPQV